MICDSSASGSGQPARRGLIRKKAETAAWLRRQPSSRLVKDFATAGRTPTCRTGRFVVVNRRRFVAADERKRADAALAASAARVSLRRALQPVSFGAPLATRALRAVA